MDLYKQLRKENNLDYTSFHKIKKVIFALILVVFIVNNVQSISVITTNIKKDLLDITLTLTVEKKSLGWYITTTLVNNGDEWIFVEKNGYKDIGCEIYNQEYESHSFTKHILLTVYWFTMSILLGYIQDHLFILLSEEKVCRVIRTIY